MTERRVNFFNIAEDKLYYDERKKRFVHTKNMPAQVERSVKACQFKHQRPDLYGMEKEDFEMKLKYGQQLIRQMNYQTKIEIRRLYRIMGGTSYLYFYPLMDDYMSSQAVDRPRLLRTWTW